MLGAPKSVVAFPLTRSTTTKDERSIEAEEVSSVACSTFA